ncbi:hypothetical protein QJQ45_028521, partial [Haematococcus lacustris]
STLMLCTNKVMRSSLSFTRTVLCILLCYLLCVEAIAPKPRNRPARRPPPPKRPVPLKGKAALDREYNNRKKACEQLDTIRPCIEQEVDTQNCAMRCISAACYSRHFAEELEEGELANDKAQRFKRCAREELKASTRPIPGAVQADVL